MKKSQNELIIINKNRKIQNSVSQKGANFLKGLINCHVSSVEYLSFMNLIYYTEEKNSAKHIL